MRRFGRPERCMQIPSFGLFWFLILEVARKKEKKKEKGVNASSKEIGKLWKMKKGFYLRSV